MFSRKQVAVLAAEFLGTGVLALVLLYVQNSALGVPYFVALTVGFALSVMMVVFAGNGGNHFNPAITIGMWTVRQMGALRAVLYIVAQMLGAWAAYYVYTYLTKAPLQSINSSFDTHVLIAEALGAIVLSMAFAAAVFNRYTNAKAAVSVGAAFAVALLIASSVYPATVHMNGIVNPALALSMRAFDVIGYTGWTTYALGPVLGAIIGFNLYALLFAEESSFVRVRSLVSQRLSRKGVAAVPAKAAPAPAPATKTTARAAKPSKATGAKRSTRSARTTSRKVPARRTRK